MSKQSALPLLDENAAYHAMRVFMEAYWERGGRTSDDLAVLLTNFEIDPAMRSDWAEAVKYVLGNGS